MEVRWSKLHRSCARVALWCPDQSGSKGLLQYSADNKHFSRYPCRDPSKANNDQCSDQNWHLWNDGHILPLWLQKPGDTSPNQPYTQTVVIDADEMKVSLNLTMPTDLLQKKYVIYFEGPNARLREIRFILPIHRGILQPPVQRRQTAVFIGTRSRNLQAAEIIRRANMAIWCRGTNRFGKIM